MMSDESENDATFPESYENDIYYKKYKLLLDECAQLQKSNEILVFRLWHLVTIFFVLNCNFRIQEVNKIVRRRQKEVKFFKKRLLNNYSEDWSVIPNLDIVKEEDESNTKSVAYLMLKDKIKEEKDDAEKPKPNKKTAKRKTAKSEKDPNAPKRPSNPFFQFCQEQRQILMEQLNAELKPGEAELTKQELTRQLAIKWKSLSGSDKKVYIYVYFFNIFSLIGKFQVYVDMYERSKEKYAAELSEYNMKK